MEKLKILEIVDSIQYGGVERLLYNIFSNMDLENFDITIVTMGDRYYDAEKKFNKLNIKIYGVPARKQNFLRYLIKLRRIINSDSFDIIHTHNDYWGFIPLYFAFRKGIKKRISHFHCTINNSIKMKVLARITSIFSNIKLACSISAGKSAYGQKNFEVLKNGINLNDFIFDNEIRDKIRKELNIKDTDIVIGHIGRFCSIKNQTFAINVFNKYYKTNTNSILMLIGDGPIIDECKILVNDLNLTDKVIFVGNVDNANEYYQAFDVFIFPSINEGFGMAALEAQYSGLNCLVSDSVPNEINVTNLVTFLPLNNIEIWNNELNKIKSNGKRTHKILNINNSPYNIKNVTLIIKNIYTK